MLVAKVIALQSQLVTCTDAIVQKKAPKPRFTLSFRLLCIALSKWLPDWRTLAHVMRPATVVGWHRRTARFLWRWKSRPGRPSVSRKMQALIRRLSRENPLWGAEHIREELAKLNYGPPCEDSVRKCMAKPEKPRKPSSTWLPFLRNHLDVAWAMDYHIECPHQGLGGETPVPHKAPDMSGPTRLVSTPVLGGLHHTYRHVAA